MVSVLHDSSGSVFNTRNSPMLLHNQSSNTPFHLQTSLRKHFSSPTLPHFITSYIGEASLKPSSRGYSSPSKNYNTFFPFSHSSTRETKKSILKKPSVSPFIFNHHTAFLERPSSVPCRGRNVVFEHDVLVIHYDKIEGGHLGSVYVALTFEPFNRKKMMRSVGKRREVRLGSSGSMDDRYLSFHEGSFAPQLRCMSSGTKKALSFSDDDFHIMDNTPPLKQTSISVSSSPPHNFKNGLHKPPLTHRHLQSSLPPNLKTYSSTISVGTDALHTKALQTSLQNNKNEEIVEYLKNVDFKYFEDEMCRLWLRFVVDLGLAVSANDVLVKANLSGNKVRVVWRSEGEDLCRRCLLPVQVDPYLVSARMDQAGRLFIEGLVTSKKRML